MPLAPRPRLPWPLCWGHRPPALASQDQGLASGSQLSSRGLVWGPWLWPAAPPLTLSSLETLPGGSAGGLKAPALPDTQRPGAASRWGWLVRAQCGGLAGVWVPPQVGFPRDPVTEACRLCRDAAPALGHFEWVQHLALAMSFAY